MSCGAGSYPQLHEQAVHGIQSASPPPPYAASQPQHTHAPQPQFAGQSGTPFPPTSVPAIPMTGMAVPLISGTTVTVQTTAANGMLINVPARVCLPGQVLSDLPPTPIWVYDPSTGRVMQTLTRRVIGLTDVLLCVFTGIICFLCCPCAHDTDHYTPDGRYVGKSKVTI